MLDAFAVTPAGSAPETTLHLYGVHPPLALTAAEQALPTIPFGRFVVLIATPGVVACMATLYETSDTCPPHPVTFAVNEYTAAVVGVPVKPSDVVELDAFALMPASNVPDAIAHLYGVHPSIAFIAAVYASRTVPFGRPLVVMTTLDGP